MKKKGNVVLDMVLFFMILFAFSILAKFGYSVLFKVNESMQASDDIAGVAKADLQNRTDNYPTTWDNLFVMAVILCMIFVFAASFLIDSHPLFYGISLAMLVFVFIVGAVFANVHSDVANSDGMQQYSASFPKTNFIMDHILEFGLAAAFLTMVGLFGKSAV